MDTREFDSTMKRYREFSSRTPEKIVNTKAFYIARRAVIETPKADKKDIAADLGRFIKSGKKQGRLRLAKGRFHNAPLAALIVNARRGAKGLPGLFGTAMTEAIKVIIGARMRSIAFLKSGWIQSIKAFEPFADKIGAPRTDSSAKQVGQAKGLGRPAIGQGWNAKAVLANLAGENRNNKVALSKYGAPALQRAFDAEALSMRQYIEKKMAEDAAAAGIKHS